MTSLGPTLRAPRRLPRCPGLHPRGSFPHFKELGLTYLHLMPVFRSPEGNNDGGYAVSSYREVSPNLGTMPQLADLAAELRANGMRLVLDFVFNHTSDEHLWAQRALAGDPDYQDYYLMFPDRQMPDAYERNLREIFPDVRPDSFTYRPEIDRWVWTRFNSFQWDLNYGNPAVFQSMAEEAIVHPDDVKEFIREDECQISYNPLLMALLWNSLATREVRLLRLSMSERFRIDRRCA